MRGRQQTTRPRPSRAWGATLSRQLGLGLVLACAWLAPATVSAQCVGDCNGGGTVTIDELITGVNIALGSAELSRCMAFDADGSGAVTIDELIRGVNNALQGCPVAPTATPTTRATATTTARTTDTPGATFTPTATSQLVTIVSSSSPANGEGGVSVARETILRFSAPLAADTITEDAIVAQFAGERLAARLHVSADTSTVTLFYLDPLPASARVRVTVDGERLRDGRGIAVDADSDGAPGGMGRIDFDTLTLTTVPRTAVCGRVFASQLAASGTCSHNAGVACRDSADCGGGNTCVGRCGQDEGQTCVADEDCGEGDLCVKASMNVPLAGVTIVVDGAEDELFAVTNQFGNFRLEPAPAGRFFVNIDGRTVTNATPGDAYYPFVGKVFESVAGKEINIGDIFLPLVPDGALQEVSPDEDTRITFPDSVAAEFPDLAGTVLMVPADALYFDDGTRGGRVGIAPVPPERLPARLPAGLEFPVVITVQTDGPTNFDRPAPICFPNLPDPSTGQVLPPGAPSALWSFSHDTGRFEVVGSMTVTADGRLVCTDPGVGILQPGWHGARPGTGGCCGEITDGGDPNDRTPPEATSTQECSANDCSCNASCETGNTVVLHSGEENLSRTDLVIPGRGEINFEMRRHYRSRLDYDGPLGFGWDFSYNEGLYLQPNGDVMRVGGGGHIDTWARDAGGGLSAPAGHFRDLVEQPDGTFALRSPNGARRLYDSDGRLFAHVDRYDNRMLFYYDPRGNLDRVVDAYGREIDFQFQTFRDGVDRLVKIVDFIGREVVYRYDDRGDLVEVRSPTVTGTSTGNDFPDGRTERYVYSSGFAEPELNHNIVQVIRPQEVADGGPPAMLWTYGADPLDPLTFDRVLTETVGGTNASAVAAGGTRSFVYESLNDDLPPGDPDVTRGKVTITERNGNVVEYFTNELNHHIITRQLTRGLRQGEPPFYETRSFFDADGKLLRQVYPEGNEMRLVYDDAGPRAQQQNVIERRQAAGPRGGGEDLVATYTYEPLYNQMASVTEPRGNATGFVPPLGTASAERYTTRYFYDYQESNDPVEQAEAFGIDLSSVPRGLGDLNGDGRTDQSFGKLVRLQEPSVLLPPAASPAGPQEIVTEIQWNDRGQVLAQIDPGGNVNETAYYPENDPDGDGRTTLDVFGPLSTDPIGYLRSVTVDARISPRRIQTATPAALETRRQYDPVGNVIATRNPRGVVTTVEVNALNEPVAVTRGADVSEAIASGQLLTSDAPLRYPTRLFYDHNGRVVKRERPNRDSTTAGVGDYVERSVAYDILDNVVQSTIEVDATTALRTRYDYDEDDLPTLIVQPEGNQLATAYDERNLPFTMTRGLGSPAASTVRIGYDRNGNRRRVADAEDNDGDGAPDATTYTYDGFDRPIAITDAVGNQVLMFYDVHSNVVRQQVMGHPAGMPGAANVRLRDVFFRHDELDRVFQTDEALFLADGFAPARSTDLRDGNSDGFVTTRVDYDALSRVLRTVEDDLEATESTYDGVNRLIEAADALGNRVRTEYDRNSNALVMRSLERSPDGLVADQTFTSHTVYDQLDRPVRFTDNAGQTVRLAYDSRDNVVSRSDAEGPLSDDPLDLFAGQINGPGNTITYVQDGLDRLVRQVSDLRVDGHGGNPLDTSNPANPDGQIALAYAWDGNSRLAAIVDDNGNRTSMDYDALDRLIRRTNADGTHSEYVYDRDDNLRQATDPNGSMVTNTHDALNRLLQVDVARAAGVGGTSRETYQYDGLSRLTRTSDDNGVPAAEQRCERVYDSLSRLLEERQNGGVISAVWSGDGKRLAWTYPGGRTISQSFDALDRAVTVNDASGLIAESSWIGPGYRLLRREHGNGTGLSLLDASGTAAAGYDAIKRLVGLRSLLPDGTTAFVDRTYGYNRANQRTSEARRDDAGLTDAVTYDSAYRIRRSDFDTGGSAGSSAGDLVAIEYRLDGVGNRRQVTTTTMSAGTATAAQSTNEMNEYPAIDGIGRSHDANGNLLDDGARLFRYDYKDRLVEVRDKASGLPIAQYRYHADGRRSRAIVSGTFAHDTAFFYDGWRECEEQNGSTGQTEATYVFAPDYLDSLLQLERTAAHPLGAGAFYLHQNARADVVAVTDGAGVLVEKLRYDDYGRPEQLSSAGNPYLFQGRRFDPESGLYYYRHRHYDPGTGRFLQRDPEWDPMNVGNRYTFVGNGPLTRVDPYGLNQTAPPKGAQIEEINISKYWQWFKEAWYETHIDERVKRAEKILDATDESTTYLWMLGDELGITYVTEAMGGWGVDEERALTGKERAKRGAYGLAMSLLNYFGMKGAAPKGQAASKGSAVLDDLARAGDDAVRAVGDDVARASKELVLSAENAAASKLSKLLDWIKRGPGRLSRSESKQLRKGVEDLAKQRGVSAKDVVFEAVDDVGVVLEGGKITFVSHGKSLKDPATIKRIEGWLKLWFENGGKAAEFVACKSEAFAAKVAEKLPDFFKVKGYKEAINLKKGVPLNEAGTAAAKPAHFVGDVPSPW